MAKNYTDIMIDIETLSVKPNAQVLSIGAVAFDPFEITTDFSNNPKLDLLLNIDEQANRDVQDETIWWWSMREPEVQARIFSETGRTSVNDALDQLIKFCWLKDRIWAQGVTLDITVLTNLFEERNKGIPWKYHTVRDSRTLLDLFPVTQPPVTHDSIQDCFRQVMGVQQALNGLHITSFNRIK
jgi:hypothetical protein